MGPAAVDAFSFSYCLPGNGGPPVRLDLRSHPESTVAVLSPRCPPVVHGRHRLHGRRRRASCPSPSLSRPPTRSRCGVRSVARAGVVCGSGKRIDRSGGLIVFIGKEEAGRSRAEQPSRGCGCGEGKVR